MILNKYKYDVPVRYLNKCNKRSFENLLKEYFESIVQSLQVVETDNSTPPTIEINTPHGKLYLGENVDKNDQWIELDEKINIEDSQVKIPTVEIIPIIEEKPNLPKQGDMNHSIRDILNTCKETIEEAILVAHQAIEEAAGMTGNIDMNYEDFKVDLKLTFIY